jgi:hypothetical protein
MSFSFLFVKRGSSNGRDKNTIEISVGQIKSCT